MASTCQNSRRRLTVPQRVEDEVAETEPANLSGRVSESRLEKPQKTGGVSNSWWLSSSAGWHAQAHRTGFAK